MQTPGRSEKLAIKRSLGPSGPSSPLSADLPRKPVFLGGDMVGVGSLETTAYSGYRVQHAEGKVLLVVDIGEPGNPTLLTHPVRGAPQAAYRLSREPDSFAKADVAGAEGSSAIMVVLAISRVQRQAKLFWLLVPLITLDPALHVGGIAIIPFALILTYMDLQGAIRLRPKVGAEV